MQTHYSPAGRTARVGVLVGNARQPLAVLDRPNSVRLTSIEEGVELKIQTAVQVNV
ncbi:hypothetical protein KR51_00003000 [Rubidibacter lacunae KORDI 51-2]|uniref:Uncharacterized protein n=1 Tax=Rubidibacter lacunae KORDI 51-2 TaxID=582515 RepID=U5DQU1_9CHRO|nr:hypothetical protein [Rubidibacter lacunae]ERN42989.1 hypothetical protein KR51_00003000 [Rubidibacter lacunae KORDI 51-2]